VSTQRADWLVWTTRIATIVALPCPLADLLQHATRPRIRIPLPAHDAAGAMLQPSFEVLAVCLLLWRFGKVLCAALAALTIAVALNRRVGPQTRAITVAAGSLTCCLLLWWLNTIRP